MSTVSAVVLIVDLVVVCFLVGLASSAFWHHSTVFAANWIGSHCRLEPRGSGLGLLKSTFSAEDFLCLGLCPAILSQFNVEMWAASKNCEKFTENLFFRGGFKVIDVDKSKKLVISACYDKQHVCTYLQPFSH